MQERVEPGSLGYYGLSQLRRSSGQKADGVLHDYLLIWLYPPCSGLMIYSSQVGNNNVAVKFELSS